jgi:hypothetical protein
VEPGVTGAEHDKEHIDENDLTFLRKIHVIFGTRPVLLFEPERPRFPRPEYMQHFIPLFFEQLGAEFPFVDYDEISIDHWDQALSPLLANCIAAMATRCVLCVFSQASDPDPC